MRDLARLLLVLSAILLAAPAPAERRVALVIGNSDYKHAPALANPKNDAEGVAESLRRLKFDVLAGTDLDKPGMERLLQAFSLKLETADVALVFYAGHGLQVNGRNYLVPVDARLEREADLVFQAVPLDVIQGLMEQSQRTNIMILDACRDNPLARSLARTMGTRSTAIGNGLGETKAGIGTLIVYATQPGNVALDGEGKNSPFTASLLRHIEAPGLEIRQVLTRVRNEVITATRDKQVPWDSSSLRGDFFFASAPGTTPVAPTPVTPPPPTPDNEALFWQSIQNSKNAADFKDYLARWPIGTFAELAKRRIAELEKVADVTPPAPEKSAPPAPDKPAVQQRTSTFETGVGLAGNILTQPRVKFTARQCQALCLTNLQCVAWEWYQAMGNEVPITGPGVCQPFRSFQRSERSGDRLYISGVIRTTPAAAPAQPVAPQLQPGNVLVQEIIRKAQANQWEENLCRRITWPFVGDFSEFIRTAQGGVHAHRAKGTNGSTYCHVRKLSPIFVDRGQKCRRYEDWFCAEGGICRHNPELLYCEMSPGYWTNR